MHWFVRYNTINCLILGPAIVCICVCVSVRAEGAERVPVSVDGGSGVGAANRISLHVFLCASSTRSRVKCVSFVTVQFIFWRENELHTTFKYA